jgi:hypothetical protein
LSARAAFPYLNLNCSFESLFCRIWRIDGSCTDTRKQLQGDFGLTSEQRRRRSLYSTHYNDDSLAEETKRLQGSFINQASLGRPAVAQWLTRELQALLLQEDVELLVQHILGNLKHIIEALSVENTRLKKPGSGRVAGERAVDIVAVAMAPYLPEHAKKLGHEFIGFVVSGLNIDAHDAVVFRIKEEEEEADEEDIEEDGTELPLPPTA